jgi:hypothetical protein
LRGNRNHQSTLQHRGAIATSAANFCPAEFNGTDHGKPLLRRVWLKPSNFKTRTVSPFLPRLAPLLALPAIR